MGSMRRLPSVALRLALAALALSAPWLVAAENVADETSWRVLRGSCYCRGGGVLGCVADLTYRECERRCVTELCDDWFWNERRPCWNWGYGG